jgi:hypothetical protein
LKRLAEQYNGRVQFLDVLVRQAHPGGEYRPYRSDEEKLASARDYKRDEQIPWPVLVDDLAGRVHTTYGTMSDPVYLIDAGGHVAFYGMWTYAPKLREAIDDLLAKGGHGIAAGGIDQTPHLAAAFIDGWRGVSRGGIRGLLDYELGVPGSTTLTFLGEQAKPLLAPIALRTTPLPRTAYLGLAVGLLGLAVIGARRLRNET